MSVAETLRAFVKDLTPGDVHVAGPVWPSPSKRRRLARAIRRHLGKTLDPGLYVCRPLTEECERKLLAWLPGDAALDANPHVTIVHSKNFIPWVPDGATVTVPRSQFLGFKTLGQDRAQVLRFRSPSLQRRWSAARSEGATWDFPAYLPHLTLYYGGASLADEALPPFDLVFGPEVAGPVNKDVFKSVLEEELAEAVHDSWLSHQSDLDDEHSIPYPDLDERAKQVDRDAVKAVVEGLLRRGYSVGPVIEALAKMGTIAFDPALHPKGAGGKYVSTGGPKVHVKTFHHPHVYSNGPKKGYKLNPATGKYHAQLSESQYQGSVNFFTPHEVAVAEGNKTFASYLAAAKPETSQYAPGTNPNSHQQSPGGEKPPLVFHVATPKPPAPVMFTGKEGNIGKFQQGLVDKLTAAKDGQGVANVVLPKSASASVKAYQKALLEHHGAADLPVAYAEPTPKPAPQYGEGKNPNSHQKSAASQDPATNTLANTVATKAPNAKPKMALSPALNTSYPLDQQKLFTQKVVQLQQAYQSNNPANALAAIPVGSPALSAYKQQLQGQIAAWEASKPVLPASVGETVSSLKIVTTQTAPEPWTAFPTRQHANFAPGAAQYRASLTNEEKSALNTYQGSGYQHINGSLRADPLHTSAQHDALDRVLFNTSLHQDTLTIRNFSSTTLVGKSKGLVGRVIEDPAYMSSSLKGHYGSSANVRVMLNVPKGTKALYLNGQGGGTSEYEQEVLLARRTRWRVDAVEITGPGKVTIKATVLPPHQQPSIPHGKKY